MGVYNNIQRAIVALAICAGGQAYAEVTLPGYGRFSGTTLKETISGKPLSTTVHAWLGIDFASQPVGEARFSIVGPPASFEGVKNAAQYGASCVQDAKLWPTDQEEACLNMNIYRPENISANAKLPVLVWVYGGAFMQGSARSFDGAAFVASAKEPLIVVTFNYRINALGFLPSLAFERLGLLNLGLRDQQRAFEFVQKYISVFGGDPRRVTIGGRSAGAHSVGIHLFHNEKKVQGASPLFSQAILQSGSVTARAFPPASFPLYQTQFARFLHLVGCEAAAAASDAKLLECLRTTPLSAIRKATQQIYETTKYAITWPFQPTLGGTLLEHRGSAAGANGEFFHVPILTSNTLDEAKFYAPFNLTTEAHFLAFLSTSIPGLNPADLKDLAALYPDPTLHPDSPYTKSPVSSQYNRISAALTDYMYVCPGQETAVRISPSAPVYKLSWAVNNNFPAWQGIPHTADTAYTWAEPTSPTKGGLQFPDAGALLHGYYTNFITHGDPNKGNGIHGLALQAPNWPPFKDDVKGGKPGVQLRMEGYGNSTVQPDSFRRKQCEWWRDGSRAERLQK